MHWLNLFAKFSVTERTAGPWLQAKTQQPIGVVGPVIIHVNGLVIIRISRSLASHKPTPVPFSKRSYKYNSMLTYVPVSFLFSFIFRVRVRDR